MKKLFVEIAVIIVLAGTVGIIWNHRMLYSVWSGRSVPAATPPSGPQNQAGLPIPAGLMQVKELFDRRQAVFVDAREGLVFTQGHIKGAYPLSIGSFDSMIAEFKAKVATGETIVVYCNGYSCHDSMTVGNKLKDVGYGSVLVFEGGYPEWKDAGFPVEGVKP